MNDPKGNFKNVKTLCNYEITSKLFYQKNTLFSIVLQFRTILLRYKPVGYREDNISKQIEKRYVQTVLSAVPSKIIPLCACIPSIRRPDCLQMRL